MNEKKNDKEDNEKDGTKRKEALVVERGGGEGGRGRACSVVVPNLSY